MFVEYAPLVKNLRGVVFSRFGEETNEILSWLTKRFRYRNLGVPPSIVEKLSDFFKDKLGGKPFIKLVYPFKNLEKLGNFLSESFNVEFDVVETVVMASAYVSPIFAVGEEASKSLETFCVDYVESNIRLNDFGWKLHFRIVDYTVLDMYKWSTFHVKQLWSSKLDLTSFVKERQKKVLLDKKRYWRLQKGNEKPVKVVLYLDPAQLIAKKIVEDKNFKRRFLKFPVEETEAGLAVETAIVLSESLLGDLG